MRIGIITFHCSYNYGSAWQAYALKEYLCACGHEARIIHFVSPNFRQYRLLRMRRRISSMADDVRCLPANLRRRTVFQQFWKKQFALTRKYTLKSDWTALNAQFDAFICGSDQIWNLDCTHGIIGPFFLDFAEKRRIAYAPSLAHRQFTQHFDEDELRRLLSRFDALSVREEESVSFVEQYAGRRPETVADPTMLLDWAAYQRRMKPCPTEGKYILAYELSPGSPRLRDYVNALAGEKGLRVVGFQRRREEGCEHWQSAYGASPEQWLYLLQHAEYVVSNSFHATIFSLWLKKQFVTFATENSSSRMIDLLRRCGLEERLYGERVDMDREIPYDEVEKRLDGYIEASKRYLECALRGM